MSAVPNEPQATAPLGVTSPSSSGVPISLMNPAGLPSSQLLFAPAEVDATTRVPVLLFFGSAVLWLLLGSILSVVAGVKLVIPELLSGVPFLTIGRLLPASEDIFIYGWAVSAALGAGFWIMSRLCRTPLRDGGSLSIAWVLWNLGLTLGVLGVLGGHATGFKLLDFPKYVSPILFSAFIFVAIWVVLMFRYRRPGPLYVSQWMILTAFLWFPWAYGTANLLIFFTPVQPAVQALIHSWYLRCLLGVWFTLMALGLSYYIVPKVMGRPVHRYSLSPLVFWGVVIFFSWSGAYYLIGGPVPAWILSLSIVGNTLLLVPAFVAFQNLRGTLEEKSLALRHSPSLRFTMVGVPCFLAATIVGTLFGFRWINAVAHFTLLSTAQETIMTYAFVSMVLFGAIYYIVPRLLELEWASPSLIRAHFWLSVIGVGLLVSTMGLGGCIQGLGLADAKVPFIALTDLLYPLLITSALCSLILLTAHVCFAASAILISFKLGFGVYETRRALHFSAGDSSSHHVVPSSSDFAASSVS